MDARLDANLSLYTPERIRRSDPDHLIENNLPLVRRIAWHTHGRVSSAFDIEELVQIGLVALIEAAQTFEDRGEAAFSTYASIRIRGAMIDALRKRATMCRSALKRRREINAARHRLASRLGREPDGPELAEELGVTLAALNEDLDATQGIQYESMEEIYSDHSIWFASERPDALEALEEQQRKDDLIAAIGRLPEREALVLQLYFVEERNLEEIGQILGVGAARVCQIKKVALTNIRKLLPQWDD